MCLYVMYCVINAGMISRFSFEIGISLIVFNHSK